ncbi:MAG TPA: hypothetical protein VKU02_11005 [Gemmataceae bacterium]|nr:hypothetical protein [Gemmataceae bacterium]
MKKTSWKRKNFADVLATQLQFAVLTKPGRVQILVKPSAKELRKRGRRGWQLFGTVDHQRHAALLLDEIVKKSIAEVEPPPEEPERKEKKPKAKKLSPKE